MLHDAPDLPVPDAAAGVSESSLYGSDVTLATLGEVHAAALAALPSDVADFLESGAGTESTLRANRAAFERRAIVPRPMSGVTTPDLSTSVLGIPLALPIMTAPFGGDALFHPEGHRAVARANAAMGTVSIVPEAGSHALEDIAAEAPAAARIAQLHPIEPEEHVATMVRRARDAGYTALCVTVDCPIGGFRSRNRVNRFAPDLAHFAGNLDHTGTIGVAELFGRLLTPDRPTWTWDRLGAFLADAGMPWIAKGILTPDAAEAALGAGASGLVVSNHGGRQLDPAPASLDALPAVAAAVDGRVPILLDSGVRTGSDVLVALALGADAVVLARAAAYGLAAGGEHGVRCTLELLAEELTTLMVLAGAPSVSALDPTFVTERPA